jgi:hypothetical protein
MTTSTTVAMSILLLSLGAVALVLAYVAGTHSVRGAGRRAGALSALGLAALAGTVLLLWGEGWSSVVDDMLWPLLVYSSATLAGAGVGAALVYGLVAAR